MSPRCHLGTWRPGPCQEVEQTVRGGQVRGTQQTSNQRKDNRQMARLVGVDLPRDKRVEVALSYIFGIGRTRSHETLAATGVSPDMRVHELGDDELVKLRD